MSLISTKGSLANYNSNELVTESLDLALAEFMSVLTDEERKQLQRIQMVPDASAALVFTAKLDLASSGRKGKSIGSRMFSILQSVQQFSRIVETFISSNPSIAAFVWGSIKLTILIATNFTSYFESLVDLFMNLNKLCPQFEVYQLLYPNTPQLQRSICEFHASIVQLCRMSILLTRQSWARKMTSSLRDRLQTQVNSIERRAKDVDKAIALAKAMSDRMEQEFQKQELDLATKQRNKLLIFALQSQRELENLKELQNKRDQELMRKTQKELLDSLSTYNYITNFNQARKKRHINTATWLFSTPEFSDWKTENTPSVFILTGKLGSGKTVLTSSVIEHLYCQRTKTDELITFVFPRFDDPMSLRAETLLRSIIRQSLESDSMLCKKDINVLRKLEIPYSGMDTIKTLLDHCCCCRFSTFYIVIDSLDEFDHDELHILFEGLSHVFASSTSRFKVKLFLVGRDSVARDIRKHFPTSYYKSADCLQVQVDIAAYIKETITKKWGEERIIRNPELVEDIIEALTHGANGMFLWVYYQITEISKQTSDHEIRMMLKSLPRSLEETFDRALVRILKKGQAKRAISVFQWTAVTKRPLGLDELEEALSFDVGQAYSIVEKTPNNLKESVTNWCENLVQLDDELDIVQFPHHSVLEYFTSQPSDLRLLNFHINLKEVDHFIGEICVTYLNLNDFKTTLVRSPGALPTQLPNHVLKTTSQTGRVASGISYVSQKFKPKNLHMSTQTSNQNIIIGQSLRDRTVTLHSAHPFLKYASKYWLLHTRSFENRKSQMWNVWAGMIPGSHALARTEWSPLDYEEQSPIVHNWIEKYDHFPVFQLTLPRIQLDSQRRDLVYRYAKLGRSHYVEAMIKLGIQGYVLSNGLIYAARDGHSEVVQVLLNAEADANAADAAPGGLTALQAAAEGGHSEVVRILLEAKADVNAAPASHHGSTALQAAARGGYSEVVQILLNAGADANAAAASYYGFTALQAAVRGGHLEVIQILLNAKADVNATAAAPGGLTALQAAAEGGYLEVIQILLNAGADINAAAGGDYNEFTALQTAARGGHLEVVQALLNAGADVNAAASGGLTALQAAAEGGHLEVVRTLLNAGADINAAASGGLIALQAAAGGGHLEVVQILLIQGADVNATASGGLTALQAAAEGGHLEVVRILLEAKADVNATPATPGGVTALQAAARGGHLEVVKILLEATADVNATASYGLTALQAAAKNGYSEVVRILLNAGADVNAAASHYGFTALQAAARGGHLEVVQILLNAKADVNAAAASDYGLTALQAAAESGHVEVIQILLNAKADVNAAPASHHGLTALQAAARGGHLEVVQILLNAKADVNAAAAASCGSTALQAATRSGHLDIKALLNSHGARR